MSDTLLIAAILLAGLVLIAVELILVPGFTFFGVAGIAVMVVGFVVSFVRLGGEQTLYLLIGCTVLGFLLAWWAGRVGAWRSMVNVDSQEGTTSQRASIGALVGTTGRAHSTLRPAGKAVIDGSLVDVVAEGGFIEMDEAIEVIRVDGNRVVVRKVRDSGRDSNNTQTP